MPLGDVTAKSGWREIDARLSAAQAAARSTLLLVLVAFGFLTLTLAALPEYLPGWLFSLARWLLFAAVFLAMPLRLSLRCRLDALRSPLLAVGIALTAVAISFFSTPAEFRLGGWVGVPTLPPLTAALVPVLIYGYLWGLARDHPGIMRSLGFSGSVAVRHAVIGLALGITLGFHLWTAAASLPGEPAVRLASQYAYFWLAMVTVGVLGLGEEVALRGLLYSLGDAEARRWSVRTWLRIAVLNLPLFLYAGVQQSDPALLLLGLTYGFIFAILATFLRHSLRSIVPALAANLAFSLFLAGIITP